MGLAILGRKLGMTQVFDDEGYVVPVTVVSAGPCAVLEKKSAVGADGYNAIKLGFGEVKPKRLNKPQREYFKKLNQEPKRHVREVRCNLDDLGKFEVGGELKVDYFVAGAKVDVTGTSKGSGFTGVMVRHNFAGAKASHGTHEYFRHGGSIGCSAWPSKTFKGKRMPGQHGNVRKTIQNLVIFKVDAERNELWIRGAIPGPTNGLVVVQEAVKKPAARLRGKGL